MRTRQIIVGIVILMNVLTAFAVIPATTARAAPATAPKNILYVAMQQDVPDFNTWSLASNSVWKADVINWGFETLAGLDMNLVPYPLLAQNWTFDQTNLTVTIHLRQGVLFHDGTQMTADDVVAMYTYARSGTTYSANIINAFDKNRDGVVNLTEIQQAVQKVDAYTVVMKMAHSYGQFFTSTLGVPILPKHVWDAYLTNPTDQLIDVTKSNVNMTIGTGPMMYAGGVAGSYRVMDRFNDYWGKNFTTPYMNKRIYPTGVDEIYFKIYASIDTAILALQSKAVDYIAWAVTPGRVSSLQADPSIGLEYLSDNGYFYLAFNEKFQPMNNLSFRKAVSYLINKDQIVNLYMGGFGTKGSACEPPFWGDWMNTSVPTYSYDASLNTSKALLDAAGYNYVNGWRALPNGAPMPKITILTPPADYDPIRIRAGQMIANNLRAIGINAEAKAIDFNTLVADLQTMNYQMLIIGWSLSSEPVGNVFDILGPKSSSNTFGFWAANDPNPFYASLMGVNTLADNATQNLAREVDRVSKLARSSFNVSDQIKYTLWGEGLIAQAIPVNVLYYRVNIEAYSKAWTGWTPWQGSLWNSGANIFNLANLQKTGGAGVTTVGAVNLAMSLPGTIGIGKTATGFVKAVDQLGNPLPGATVNLTVAGVTGAATVQVTPTAGTTNANGVLSISVTGTAVGYSYVNATAGQGGASATRSTTISSVSEYPNTLYVSVQPGKLVLRVGESTPINLTVTDQYGQPVAGVNLTADRNLISYGSVDSLSLTSDASGHASTTFRAPATIVQANAHEPTTLFYTATKEGYTFSSGTAINLLIYNPAPPSWVMARVNSVSKTALNATGNVSTITIQAVDNYGAALANHTMGVSYSNSSIVFSPVTSVRTDSTGNATFTVQIAAGALTQGLRVTVQNMTTLQAVPATVTLTYVGSIPPSAPLYGGYMNIDTYLVASHSMYLAPLASVKVTAHLFDENGALANGINASLMVSATPYGTLTSCNVINWDSTWDYLGTTIVTSQDKANIVTSGPLNTYFDYANWLANGPLGLYNVGFDWGMMTGVNITSGVMTFWVNGTNVAPLDLIGSIYIVPNGVGIFNSTTISYEITGPSLIASQYVVGRSYNVVAPSYTITRPVMTAKLAAPYDNTTVNVTVTDQNNNPIPGATVSVYENSVTGNANYKVTAPSGPTDSSGHAQATISAIGKKNVVTSGDVQANVYVKASMAGAVSLFQQTQLFIYVRHTFVSIAPITDTVAIGSTSIPVIATVVDWSGAPISGIPVGLTTNSGTVLGNSVVSTSSAGVAEFNVSTPMLQNTRVAYMNLQAKTGGPAYDVSLGYLVLTLQNAGPQIAASLQASKSSGVNAFAPGVNVTLNGQVFDPLGVSAATYAVDNGSSQAITGVSTGLGVTIRSVTANLGSSLATGTHTVKINATDPLGVSNTLTLTFQVKEQTTPATSTTLPWAVAAIGWVLFVVVVVLMVIQRRPKAVPVAGPGAPETEKVETPKDVGPPESPKT